MTVNEAKEKIRENGPVGYKYDFDEKYKEFPEWFAFRVWPYAPNDPKADWYQFCYWVNKETGRVIETDSPTNEKQFANVGEPIE